MRNLFKKIVPFPAFDLLTVSIWKLQDSFWNTVNKTIHLLKKMIWILLTLDAIIGIFQHETSDDSQNHIHISCCMKHLFKLANTLLSTKAIVTIRLKQVQSKANGPLWFPIQFFWVPRRGIFRILRVS